MDKRKTKWGPQLACERPRRSTNDGTILQNATELKSFRNLDGEKKRTCTSFLLTLILITLLS